MNAFPQPRPLSPAQVRFLLPPRTPPDLCSHKEAALALLQRVTGFSMFFLWNLKIDIGGLPLAGMAREKAVRVIKAYTFVCKVNYFSVLGEHVE